MSNKTNKTIQDRGWEQMHAILDKEMPVKRKRRGLLIWFWVAVLTGLISIPVLWQLRSSDEDKEDNPIQFALSETKSTLLENDLESIPQTQQVAHAKNTSPQEIEGKHNDVENSITDVRNTSAYSTSKTAINFPNSKTDISNDIKDKFKEPSIKTYNTSIVEDHKYELSNKKLGISTNKKEISTDNQEENFNTKHSTLKTLTNELKKLEDEEPSPISSEIRSELSPLVALTSRLIRPIFSKPREIKEIEPEIIESDKNELSPYLLALGMYQSSPKIKGYGLGAGVSYGTSKQSIYVEASYLNSAIESSSINSISSSKGDVFPFQDDVSFAGNEIEIESLDGDLSISNFSTITTSTREWAIGVGVRRQIVGNLNFDVGLTYKNLLRASNTAFSVNFDVPIGLNEMQSVIINSRDLFNNGAYSEFDLVPHIGLEYNMFNNFYMGISYHHGLKNLIENTSLDNLVSQSENDEIFRRYASAKIRYQF
ncbi:MAG: hypothetical protein P1U56_16515 [Saprospiraceae bacterium]|nr:hypothetical protein [Saprospiraceae bacterium]